MPLRVAVIGGLACIMSCGSASDSSAVRVEVSFDSGTPRSLRDQAVRVEVYLLGSCEEVVVGTRPASAVASTYVLRERGGPALGGDFETGEYGLYAIAKAQNCAVVAAGCEPVSIEPDGGGTVSVALGPANGVGCPAEQQCVIETGDCVTPGGGTGGAGGRAGGGGGQGGTGGTGDCASLEDETPCSTVETEGVCRMGACCTGCWDGQSCQPGNKTQTCGTGGELCQFIPGCKL